MEPPQVIVAPGDGIGPEITESVLEVLKAADVPLSYKSIEMGQGIYLKGFTSGIPDDAWDLLRGSNCLLKGPITTPQGKGFKSVNVTIRKTLNLFANIRPTKSYAPFVASPHPGMNLVIIRENEEDLYAGIEHRQTDEVTQVLKLITRPGCENIVRYAFEYAKAYGRRKVTCMTKDNIMKLTDGLFHQVFDEIAGEYPEIVSEHQIIDIGAARLAAQPEMFDVIVTLNLYGDILSDIAAQIAGSVGLAGSANIGHEMAMFEAVHGSAPDIAGKDVANPSGLLTAATQMLVHLGLGSYGETIKKRLVVHPRGRRPHGGLLSRGFEPPGGRDETLYRSGNPAFGTNTSGAYSGGLPRPTDYSHSQADGPAGEVTCRHRCVSGLGAERARSRCARRPLEGLGR